MIRVSYRSSVWFTTQFGPGPMQANASANATYREVAKVIEINNPSSHILADDIVMQMYFKDLYNDHGRYFLQSVGVRIKLIHIVYVSYKSNQFTIPVVVVHLSV